MYNHWAKTEDEYRRNQVVAVAVVLGPAVGTEMAWGDFSYLSEEWFDANLRLWWEAQKVVNSGYMSVILGIEGALGSKLTIDQIQRLNKIATEFHDPVEFVKNMKELQEFVEQVNDVLKEITK
jgi:hypothetical protein